MFGLCGFYVHQLPFSICESFYSRDSLENATTKTWMVTPKFASEKRKPYQRETYEQPPETFYGYQAIGKNEPLPVLTNIVVQSTDFMSVQYSLSADEISKLRRSSGGELRLVLYDEGIACISPGIKAYFKEIDKRPYNKEEYFQVLRDKKDEAIKWTRDVLAK